MSNPASSKPSMQHKSGVKRRAFIQGSGALAAAATMPNIFPSSVLGANERINMGIIGAGGRGRGLMREFLAFNTRFVAVNDVYSPYTQAALDIAHDANPDAKAYGDYRELLEDNDVDAVIIGTPDHQHAPNLIASVQAGKDAYLEKPMSHSIEEGVRMIEAVRATDRIVQIGMQRRSSPVVHAAKAFFDEGHLGNVYMVKAQWNWNYSQPMNYGPLPDGVELDWEGFCRPAEVVPFESARFFNWRVFWDYSGGHVTDQGTHLMDVVQWFMDKGTPRTAECFGRVYKMTGAETPDVFSAIYDYDGFTASWTLCYTNRFRDGWTIYFQGDGGTLMVDERGSRYWADNPPTEQFDHRSSAPYDPPDWEHEGPLPTRPHVENFLDCIKSREEPNAPVEVGHRAVCGPHLANVAWRNKKRAYLNPEATTVTVG